MGFQTISPDILEPIAVNQDMPAKYSHHQDQAQDFYIRISYFFVHFLLNIIIVFKISSQLACCQLMIYQHLYQLYKLLYED